MRRLSELRIIAVVGFVVTFACGWMLSADSKLNVNAGVNQNAAAAAAEVAQADKPFDQAQALAALRQAIAGKENEPAEKVFKNIQLLKGIPAGRLLRIMEMGYARSLGVNCTHCHIPGEWEKDDKPTKQVARDMAAMVGAINNQHLKQIKNLKSETPGVNCTTCHRGQTKPALNLEPPKS
jgi:hypothetical protein